MLSTVTAPVLQSVRVPTTDVDLVFGLGSGAVGAFVSTLIVGAILVAIAPDYVERIMDAVREDPLTSFLYGLLAIVLVVVLIVALVITIVGILLVPILGLVVGLVWAVGAAIAFLAIADRLVDHRDGWFVPLLVAAAINGGLTLTGIGGLVSFAVGAAGFGAILSDRFG
ncbi:MULTISPECIES: hypothetical protein [Salinibaculum]|uniref:hypothetical protein n=1 Tax=Salinibaculum TaxID=2732368 RepID=UPI0030D600F3